MASNESSLYQVKIENLSDSITEVVLLNHFKKFGPVRDSKIVKDSAGGKSSGFIHYHNHEVAEIAAQEMDRTNICGKIIRTKGPKKLIQQNNQIIYSNQNIPSQLDSMKNEKRDLRSYTDCYYFILHGNCIPKVGQVCQYRHSEKARLSKTICERWPDRNCYKKNCPKQHPGQKPDLKGSKIQRCDSHNAYKCLGHCGNISCMTHFQSKEDLLKHIEQSHALYSPCQVCNAVFFDQEEKNNHTHIKQSDSSGSFSSLSTSSKETLKDTEPIGVFWDIENCRVPKGKSTIAVVHKIRERFFPGKREVEFMCVCDTTKEKKTVLEELNKVQINVVHINATSKNAADDKLKQALRRFAQVYTSPATIVLVSGDINFASELSDLRHRHNFRVVLLHNKDASDALLLCAHECERFDIFTADLAAPSTPIQGNASHEVLITNLPTGSKHSLQRIKARLNTLANNTGGKVVSISKDNTDSSKDNVAVLRFADVDAARRAIQRLDKEEVFGSSIKASFYNVKKKNNSANNRFVSKSLNDSSTNVKSLKQAPALMDLKIPNPNSANSNKVDDEKSKNLITMTLVGDEKFSKNKQKKKENQLQNLSPVFQELTVNNSNDINLDSPNNMVNVNQKFMSQKFFAGNNMYPLNFPPPLIPSPTSTCPNNNGVDILVTNLDDNINIKEIKRKLSSLVREHSKVNSVIITGQSKENNLHAFIKVPKLQDAQTCISKLNNQMLFNRRIKVSLPSGKGNVILKLKSEVASILLETYAGWLSLNEFLIKYKEKFQHSFHILNFDLMKDLIYVDGQPGFPFVCLLNFPVGLLKVIQKKEFTSEITQVLSMHNRRVPFASLPGLYWSYLKQHLQLHEEGELLIKIVTNKSICLIGDTPAQQALFFRKPRPEKGKLLPLKEFEKDVKQLLKVSGFSVPLNKFIPLYHQYFGRQCCVVDYGFRDLNDLLKSLHNVIEIHMDGETKFLSFTAQYKKELLIEELSLLINSCEKQRLAVNSLVTSYYRFFGHKIYSRNFGFITIQALVNGLDPTLFRLSGNGDTRYITLTDEKPEDYSKSLKKFADEVALLIEAQPGKQLGLHNLSSEYYKRYGHQLKLAELGFTKLNDLVGAISDYVEIRGSRDQKTLYISDDHPNFDILWSEIEVLLNASADRALLVLQLPELYREKFMKPFPLDSVKMNHFFKSIPPNFVAVGRGPHRMIIDISPGNYPTSFLLEQVMEILSECIHFKGTPQSICNALSGRHIYVTKARLTQGAEDADLVQITKDHSIQLTPKATCYLLKHELLTLISVQSKQLVYLNQFSKIYQKHFRKEFDISNYGYSKLLNLCENLAPKLLQVKGNSNNHYVTYTRLGQLYKDSRSVLFENDGSLLLCNFAPEYQRKYNKQLKALDYGIAKIGDLVEYFSGIFKVFGEKNMKVIVLKEKYLKPENRGSGMCLKKLPSISMDTEEDVVIESEEFEKETVKPAPRKIEEQVSDLLNFNECIDVDDKNSPFEWWMEPVPEILQPALQPELTQPVTSTGFDLISFTDFNTDDDVIQNGGIDNSSIPQHAQNPFSYYSYTQEKKQHDSSSSDNYVDDIFRNGLENNLPNETSTETDLMRLLVGRCSPIQGYSPLVTEVHSPSNATSMLSSISETYSCFSALEQRERHGKSHIQHSYNSIIDNMFANHIENKENSIRTVKPRLAVNFPKH